MVKDRSAWAALCLGMLMALGGTAAAAQQEQAPGDGAAAAQQRSVPVTGTSTLVGQAAPGTIEVDGAIIRMRGNELITVEASSDPRVSGRARITVNFDAYPGPDGLAGATQVRFGRMVLENDQGAWSGHFAGNLGASGYIQTYWLQGRGAYEGLSYVVTAGGNGNVWNNTGLIFPGEIPPMGSNVSLPIEGIERDLPAAWRPPS